jgi:hypothetical protein
MSSAATIVGDAEALAVAAELTADFGKDAAERDARRRFPRAEMERLSDPGLLAVTVPEAFVRTKSRRWFDRVADGDASATDDPLLTIKSPRHGPL